MNKPLEGLTQVYLLRKFILWDIIERSLTSKKGSVMKNLLAVICFFIRGLFSAAWRSVVVSLVLSILVVGTLFFFKPAVTREVALVTLVSFIGLTFASFALAEVYRTVRGLYLIWSLSKRLECSKELVTWAYFTTPLPFLTSSLSKQDWTVEDMVQAVERNHWNHRSFEQAHTTMRNSPSFRKQYGTPRGIVKDRRADVR